MIVNLAVPPASGISAAASVGATSATTCGCPPRTTGLLMTGHETGAALGVAGLTAIAGNLATSAGLIDGYGRAFAATAGVLAALLVLTALAVPGSKPTAAAVGHAPGH